MISFRPSDPFPILDPGVHRVSELLEHSKTCDQSLGLRVEQIEAGLVKTGCRKRAPGASGEKQQIWIGLEPQMLLTPYIEIRWLLEKIGLGSSDTVIDLGAAYGRMGFVLARHFPACRFIGYEYVGERVEEGQRAYDRAALTRAKLVHADLTAPEFVVPEAQVYFLYDFGNDKAIEKILYDLKRIASRQLKPFTLIARGRRCRYSIDRSHSWLTNANPTAHASQTTVYIAHSLPELGLVERSA